MQHCSHGLTPCKCATPGYLEHFPHLAGQTFGDLPFWFDDAIVMGLVHRRTGQCEITPDPSTVVSTAGDR